MGVFQWRSKQAAIKAKPPPLKPPKPPKNENLLFSRE